MATLAPERTWLLRRGLFGRASAGHLVMVVAGLGGMVLTIGLPARTSWAATATG